MTVLQSTFKYVHIMNICQGMERPTIFVFRGNNNNNVNDNKVRTKTKTQLKYSNKTISCMIILCSDVLVLKA